MKIAYLLLCHNHPEQIQRLVNSLQDSGDFFIHVDKKSNLNDFKIRNKNNSKTIVISKYNVWWAGWSMVEAYIELLNISYQYSDKYERFVLMTGQDYPVMSNNQIINFFLKNKDVEYVMAYNLINSSIKTDINKIKKLWFFDSPINNTFFAKCYRSFMYRFVTNTKLFERKNIKIKLNGKYVDPYFGQMLSSFTRNGVKLILNTYNNDTDFNIFMKYVHAAVELYWHTIIFNSSLRSNTVQQGKEHIITEHFGWAPHHYHSYLIHTSEYNLDNYDEIINSGYMFFRKVIPGYSDSLMDKIDMYRENK